MFDISRLCGLSVSSLQPVTNFQKFSNLFIKNMRIKTYGCKWTHAVQTSVVHGPTVYEFKMI